MRRRRRATLLSCALLAAHGCVGEMRTTTTPRTAEEQLLVSTSVERAVATIDAAKLRGRSVYVDDGRLSSVDRGYVASALFDLCAMAGARLTREAAAADVIIEVRSACVGAFDGHWTVGIPALYVAGLLMPGQEIGEQAPPLIEFGYVLHEGWTRLQCFAYERESGAFVFGSREAWGYAHVGLFEDVYPKSTIGETLKEKAR